MIFNNSYNRIIALMGEIDEDFLADYELFVRKLPFGMARKCQKMEDFKCEKGDKTYKMTNYDGEEIEFIVEEEDSIHSSINLYRIDVEALKKMDVQENGDNLRGMNDTSVMEIGVFETTRKNGDKVGYSLFMCRRKDGYFAIMQKVCDDEKLNKKTVAEIDVDSVIKRKTGR